MNIQTIFYALKMKSHIFHGGPSPGHDGLSGKRADFNCQPIAESRHREHPAASAHGLQNQNQTGSNRMKSSRQGMNSQLAGAKILPLLIRLTIPITIAQLVNALYSIVDRMYIGHMPGVGTMALGGIGITFPIIMITAAFSCIPGMGRRPSCVHRHGQRRHGEGPPLPLQCICTAGWHRNPSHGGLHRIPDPMLKAFGADSSTLPMQGTTSGFT